MRRTERSLQQRLGAGGPGVPRLEEVVVLSLAAARLARAVSLDEISAPARARMVAWAQAGGTWRTWPARLVQCPVCTGWWISLFVSLVAPGRRRLLRGFAVAGGQVLLALLERLVSEEGRAAVYEADRAEAMAGPG